MQFRPAALVVFASSAAVLVVEIAAGRLMAPYVGVSLETFTGIIGVVLAGIATGAALGGRAADHRDARALLGPVLWVGGALVWASVPVVRALGPNLGEGPASIVVLATTAFFAPAAVLSAATPIVAKLRLASLEETGSVVGGLSAAGTAGALAGTFLTGFVLVTTIGTRATLFVVGGLLVVGGVGLHWWLRRTTPAATSLAVVFVAGLSVFGFDPACDYETRYACAEVRVDEDDPSRRSLYLDGAHHARVDVDDPTYLDFRYIRLFADVAASLPAGALDVLHLGGGGFTFPRYLDAVRPGTTGHVLEIDPGVVDIAEERLGLRTGPDLTVEVTDARTALDDFPTEAFDLVVGDAFSGQSVPWHLTTVEVADELDRVLRPGGVYVMNIIDGHPNDFARAEIATLQETFAHVAAILPDGTPPQRPRNQVLVASDRPLPRPDIDPRDGMLVTGAALDAYVGNATPLTDDFSPVDQMVTN